MSSATGAKGYVQLAVESAPNFQNTANSVSSTVFYAKASSFQWAPKAIRVDRSNELNGLSDNVLQDVIAYDPAPVTYTSQLYPTSFGLWMTAAHGYTAAVAGNGSSTTDPDGVTTPVGSYLYTWTAGTTNTLTRSLQAKFVYPDQAVFGELQSLVPTNLKISQSTEEIGLAVTGESGYYQQIADPSLTPTYDAWSIKPFHRADHKVETWLASTGTPVTIDYTLNNPVTFTRTLSGSAYADQVVRTGVDLRLTADLTVYNLATADIAASLAGTSFTVLSRFKSPQFITGSYPYQLWIAGTAMYGDITPDALQHKILHGGKIPIVFGNNGAASYTITLATSVASYSSVS